MLWIKFLDFKNRKEEVKPYGNTTVPKCVSTHVRLTIRQGIRPGGPWNAPVVSALLPRQGHFMVLGFNHTPTAPRLWLRLWLMESPTIYSKGKFMELINHYIYKCHPSSRSVRLRLCPRVWAREWNPEPPTRAGPGTNPARIFFHYTER